MTNDRRKLIYLRQNGSVSRLTGPQRRRLRKNRHVRAEAVPSAQSQA